MLEIKPICENCGKSLPYNSEEAMVCSFECTFCKECVDNVLLNVCPNCGGGFEKRPIRPSYLLEKYPPTKDEYLKPVDLENFSERLNKYKDVKPADR